MAKQEKKETEEKDDETPELTIVTGAAEDVDAEMGDGHESVTPPRKEAKKEAEDDEEEPEEKPEARLGKEEDTDEEEEQGGREKAAHKSRRQRRKEAEVRLRTELKFLENRNDQLERQLQTVARRQDNADLNTLEDRIAQKKSLLAKADEVIAEAITAQKGTEATEAQRIRDKVRDDLKVLEGIKEQASTKGEERPKANPRVVSNIKAWHKDNDWFDFSRGDMDSKIAGAIDDSLGEEGFDPATEDYWKELNSRLAKVLPHRVKARKNGKTDDSGLENDDDDDEDEDEEQEAPQKKTPKKKAAGATGGPKFRTGGPGRELSANEVYLSRERVAALKEAGAWDDPKLRKKYLERYKQYDLEHAQD